MGDDPPEPIEPDRLALYHFEGCWYCHRVRDVVEELGIDVELRNIFDNREWFDELVAARGRRTVPVLRITRADGAELWMPESADIIRYLRITYGESAAREAGGVTLPAGRTSGR